MSPLDLGSEAVRGRADSQESETYRAQANRPSTRQRTGESASPREVSIDSAERKGGAVIEAVLGGYGSPLNTQNAQNINPLYPFQQGGGSRSEEHTSELQSLAYLVCRLLLEKKKQTEIRLVYPPL